MIASRLERSLSRAACGPLLAPPDGEGGGGGGEAGTVTSGTDATSGGEQEGTSETFKPMTEAEQAAWKDSTRKHLLAEARKQAEADAKRKADEDAAKQKGEWEQLATDRQNRITELESEIARRDAAELRRKVAKAHNLPDDLADRLIGDDESALTEDAKKLAKTVGLRKPVDTEGGAGSEGSTSATSSDRPIRKDRTSTQTAGEGQRPLTSYGKPKVAWPAR